MGLLQDLLNGKELQLSSGSKMTVAYQADADVMSMGIGGNNVELSTDDVNKLMQIIGLLRQVKLIESKS